MHRKIKGGSADFSARLQTAGDMEKVYRKYARPKLEESKTVEELRTFERLVLRKGLIFGLNELSDLRLKYDDLRRGYLPALQGEKHPLLVMQDLKVLSPRLPPQGNRRKLDTGLTSQKWQRPSRYHPTRSSSLQWNENLQLLSRYFRSS